jgi:N-acetylmuramoyl-L-alanine amidase
MKRAQVTVAVYFRIFEILLLAVVIAAVGMEVKNAKDSGIYQQKFLARDIALVMDSVSNARGNLIYFYNPPLASLSRFTVDLRNNRASVDNEYWPYAINAFLQFVPPVLAQPTGITIQKTGNAIAVSTLKPADVSFNGLLLECPAAPSMPATIVIDPGHGVNSATGEGDKGFEAQGTTEADAMRLTAAALSTYLKNAGVRTVIGTRAFDVGEAKNIQERTAVINTYNDAWIISLHAGVADARNNVIKAFVNKDADTATYGVACRTLNALATAYALNITGTAVIPVDLSQLRADDPRQVLLKGRTAVQLELGNMNNPVALSANPRALAEVVAHGVTG